MKRKEKTYIQIDKCPVCGAEAITSWCPPGLSTKCTKCGYAVATSIFHPIDLDETLYSIYLESKQSITKENLIVISKVLGKNFLESKKILESGGLILSGLASDINEKIDYLKENFVKFEVKPEWKYFDDPLDNDINWKRV